MDSNKFKEKEQEIELSDKKEEVKDKDAARDAQRNMAWFALFGMLLYPFAVVISSLVGMDKAADVLGSMAGISSATSNDRASKYARSFGVNFANTVLG